MKRHWQVLLGLGATVFFLGYTLFWVWYFTARTHSYRSFTDFLSPISHVAQSNSTPQVQGAHIVTAQNPTPTTTSLQFSLPVEYKNAIVTRRQVFNLSCEFAAAASIVYHFTNDSFFAPVNEELAEKKLISQVGVSQNPNIGIRMGDVVSTEDSLLYENLNKMFGGSEFYGVHAPPFIDLFAKYQLVANPIQKNENTLLAIKHALYAGHLVMAWIHVGYGQTVDVALAYGSTSVFKGEHAIVITGYNADGFFVMDPGSGVERHIKYQQILDAAKLFPLPYLEVYKASSSSDFSTDDLLTVPIDKITGLDRSKMKIAVQNGSGIVGKGSEMANILRDYGYKVVSVQNAENNEFEGVVVRIKDADKDYSNLIKKDLKRAFYAALKSISDVPDSSEVDVIVIVGSP